MNINGVQINAKRAIITVSFNHNDNVAMVARCPELPPDSPVFRREKLTL